MRRSLSYLFVAMIVLVASCKMKSTEQSAINFDSLDLSPASHAANPLDTVGDGLPIFYNMYLSVEISSLFESADVYFNKEVLNTTDRISEYITSDQKALNLGIYAVDLSYARSYDQLEMAGKYLSSMQILAEELGIPADYFKNTAQRFDQNLNNKDSIVKIANDVYYQTEEYLNLNERFATSSLIILGGWIEAMSIAGKVAIESQSVDIIERFAEQKYSLNNLMTLLQEYEDDAVVAEYLVKLKALRELFFKLDVDFPVDYTNDDPEFKKQLDEYMVLISQLHDMISGMRKEIVS